MTTYNTGNPLGSVDPRDLYDNSENLDDFSNGPLNFYADRLDVSRQSLQGIRNASQYQIIGAYGAGLNFTSYNQVFSYLGEFYAPSAGLTLPYTTTGAGAGELETFRSVGDAILRSDLAAAGGVSRVSGAVRYASTVVGFDSASVEDGVTVICSGRSSAGDGGGGTFTFYSAGSQTVDSGIVFAPSAGGRLVRLGWMATGFNGPINPVWFGVVGDNAADDTAAFALTIAASIPAMATIEVPGGLAMRITSSLDMPPTLRIVGAGGAVQLAPKFISVGGINIFTARSGFASESACFENLQFDSATPGTGTAFAATNTSYISQATFRNVAFRSNLRYGINAPIVLCSFYDCDFGSYPGTQENFSAINSVGTAGSFEPNANCFFKCVFRKSSAPFQINWEGFGVQWNFYACDFEQNTCSDTIVRCNGSGPVNFYSGYLEANTTPYFLRIYGNTSLGFTNVVRLHGVQLNNPCTSAILKREIIYPYFDIQGCYGLLNCNVTQNQNGVFNSKADLEGCHGNHFTAGTGSFGSLDTVSVPGYTNRRLQVAELSADTTNAVKKLAVSVTAITAIAALSNPLSSSAINYGGQLTITARSGATIDDVSELNTATYLLLVNKGGISNVTLISSNGVTAGGAASHPSFTWTMSGSTLQATPIASTTGTFSFLITASGMVKAS